MEVRQFDQYAVRVDGSGRITLRNRKFLRKFAPLHKAAPPRMITEDLRHLGTPFVTSMPSVVASPSSSGTEPSTAPDVQPTPVTPHASPESTPPASMSSTPLNIAPPTSLHTPRVEDVLDVPQKKKVPLALRRLQTYNNKGLKED